MVRIRDYREADTDEIIDLVLYCQNWGDRAEKTVDDQPELKNIRAAFIESGGGFWVAEEDGRVVGSIGLICRGETGIMKKFFLYDEYRGRPERFGRQLYGRLLERARARGLRTLVLDTPGDTERAHRFYEKAGFRKVEKAELPVQYDPPYPDCDFFRLDL